MRVCDMVTAAFVEKVKLVGDTTGRKEQFRTLTLIAQRGSYTLVRKQAGSEQAKKFLRTIIRREKMAQAYFGEVFEVVTGQLRDGEIIYEYLPYESLQQTIGGLLEIGGFQRANELFNEYINKLAELNRSDREATQFYETIAGGLNCEEALDCFDVGVIDLLPRNILLIDGKWAVVDNEWCFDFPVPVKFVKFRAIRELAMTIQRQIRAGTCAGNPARAVFGSGINTYYVPYAWLERMELDEPGFGKMLRWEAAFQRYVTGYDMHVGRIKEVMAVRKKFAPRDTAIAMMMKRAGKKLPWVRDKMRQMERKMLLGGR